MMVSIVSFPVASISKDPVPDPYGDDLRQVEPTKSPKKNLSFCPVFSLGYKFRI